MISVLMWAQSQQLTCLGVILKKSLLACLFATAGLAFTTSAFAQAPAKMLPLAAEVIVLTATVDSVDLKKRIVVLKDANGNTVQMNVAKTVNDLDKVKKWADKHNCYTNKSTGLHINISVPDYSLEKLDYIKLALLMGDQYVLDQFGRAGNTYCKSAMSKIRDKIKAYRENFMRAGLVNKNFASRLSRPFLNILESFPCYKDNYALITRYIEASEAKVGEISATLAGVSTLNGRTVASKSLIEATSVHSPASSSKGLGTGARAGGTAPKKSSSITGVEEEAARRGQGKKP